VTRGNSETKAGISEGAISRSETVISNREACAAGRVSDGDNIEIIRARREKTFARLKSTIARFLHDLLVTESDQKVIFRAVGDGFSNVSH
jgi:hypothetical protein